MTDKQDSDSYRIQDGEKCPRCETDISFAGKGCTVEVMNEGELAEIRRKCYNCLLTWTVETYYELHTDTNHD